MNVSDFTDIVLPSWERRRVYVTLRCVRKVERLRLGTTDFEVMADAESLVHLDAHDVFPDGSGDTWYQRVDRRVEEFYRVYS